MSPTHTGDRARPPQGPPPLGLLVLTPLYRRRPPAGAPPPGAARPAARSRPGPGRRHGRPAGYLWLRISTVPYCSIHSFPMMTLCTQQVGLVQV